MDMTTAVSRQALLDKCVHHFPELPLPGAIVSIHFYNRAGLCYKGSDIGGNKRTAQLAIQVGKTVALHSLVCAANLEANLEKRQCILLPCAATPDDTPTSTISDELCGLPSDIKSSRCTSIPVVTRMSAGLVLSLSTLHPHPTSRTFPWIDKEVKWMTLIFSAYSGCSIIRPPDYKTIKCRYR
eukprot:Em0011g1094a